MVDDLPEEVVVIIIGVDSERGQRFGACAVCPGDDILRVTDLLGNLVHFRRGGGIFLDNDLEVAGVEVKDYGGNSYVMSGFLS